MRYRRTRTGGATWFFTVNLADRHSRLLVERIEALRATVREVKRAHPFEILAWVVLPEHIHAVWALPPGDADYSTRWNLIKGGFSQRVPKVEPVSRSRSGKRERGIWQRRFWEHLIRDEADLTRHLDYVHYNPVKHGHVRRVRDWPFSSFHREVRLQRYPAEWGRGEDPFGDFGEPV